MEKGEKISEPFPLVCVWKMGEFPRIPDAWHRLYRYILLALLNTNILMLYCDKLWFQYTFYSLYTLLFSLSEACGAKTYSLDQIWAQKAEIDIVNNPKFMSTTSFNGCCLVRYLKSDENKRETIHNTKIFTINLYCFPPGQPLCCVGILPSSWDIRQ